MTHTPYSHKQPHHRLTAAVGKTDGEDDTGDDGDGSDDDGKVDEDGSGGDTNGYGDCSVYDDALRHLQNQDFNMECTNVTGGHLESVYPHPTPPTHTPF